MEPMEYVSIKMEPEIEEQMLPEQDMLICGLPAPEIEIREQNQLVNDDGGSSDNNNEMTRSDKEQKRPDYPSRETLEQVDAEKKYVCEVCNKSFMFINVLKSHMTTHEYEQFTCETCGKCFTNKMNLASHVRKVHGDKKHVCNVCGRCFAVKRHLAGHMLTHTDRPQMECDICHKKYKSRYGFQYHMETVHSNVKYECDICHRGFKCYDYLYRHNQSVHKAKPPKKIIEADEMKRIRINSAYSKLKSTTIPTSSRNTSIKTPFQCEKCLKYFASQRKKSNHNRRMHGNKRVTCLVCSKTFADRFALNTHLFSHSKEPLFECSICKKKYGSKNGLDFHMEGHSGVEYTCDLCSKVFKNHNYLVTHIRNYHLNRDTFKCDMCDKVLKSERNLRSHKKNVHKPQSNILVILPGPGLLWRVDPVSLQPIQPNQRS